MGTLADIRCLLVSGGLGRGPSWFVRGKYWHTEAQSRVLGFNDLCGPRINYLDFDNLGT